MIRYFWIRTFVLALFFFLLFSAGCAGRIAFKKAEKAMAAENVDLAVEYFRKAIDIDPSDVRYRVGLTNALILASNLHLKRAVALQEQGELKLALLELQRSLDFNSENSSAKQRKIALLKRSEEERRQGETKSDIEQLKDKVNGQQEVEDIFAPDAPPMDLKHGEIDLKVLFKLLQKSYGVRFLFDEGFQSKKISVDLENVQPKDALEKILMQTGLFYKVIDKKTLIIIPDTPAKRKEYDELMMRTFFLSNADPEQVQKIIRELTGIRVAAINPTLNSITLRDTPQKIEAAERIIHIQDKPRPELSLEVEIIEVNRNRMKEYGIELSDYAASEYFSPTGPPAQADAQGQTKVPYFQLNDLRFTNAGDFFFTIPSISYKLLQADSRSRIKAKPQLRVVDQETVEIRLGDKVPIPTTTFVPGYGQGSVSSQPITSFQLQDVGINIKLTPRIHHDGWVTIKLEFEFTFVTVSAQSDKFQFVPPTIGNRSLKTAIRLQDSETALLAGLLRDTERKGMRGFPGIVNIPILRDIFSGNTNEIDQTDIILTITPRIVRFPDIEEADLVSYWMGTEENIGLKSVPPYMLGKNKKENISKSPQPSTNTASRIIEGAEKSDTVKDENTEKAATEKLVWNPQKFAARPGEPFWLSLSHAGTEPWRMLELEIANEADKVEVAEVKLGDWFSRDESKASMMKTVTVAGVKVKVALAADAPAVPAGSEIIRLRCSALHVGQSQLRLKGIRLLGSGMQEIPVSATDLTIDVSENIKEKQQ